MIHVCSLARLHATIADTGARHVVTLLDHDEVRLPEGFERDNHLHLRMHDISGPMDGYVMPKVEQVDLLLAFVRKWNRAAPIVIHCWAGISRSTAAAFAAACALNPGRDEHEIAKAIRRLSPTALPNARIVHLADGLLDRKGRMITAVEALGPAAIAIEGHPFRLDLE
jgi:predicted protein tyrosine phosphatase